MKKALFLLAFVFLGVVVGLRGQKQVTIVDCQRWAVDHSSSAVQKKLNAQLLRVKLNDASSHYYPTLEISGMISYQSQVPEIPNMNLFPRISKDQYHVGLNLYQKLFDGGKIFINHRFQRLDNENEIAKLDISINQLKEQVISIYLNILIVNKQIEILSSVESTLREQLSQLQALHKEGMIYGNAITELELEEMKIEQKKSELHATHESLQSSLSILTGQDFSRAEFIIPSLPDLDVSDLSSRRLEYTIFNNQIAGLEYQRKLYYANTMPQLAVVATGGYGRTTFNIFSNHFDWYYFVGLKLDIPVINWARTTGVGNIIQLQKLILEAQKADYEKSNNIDIQEKTNEIKRIEKLLVLDKQITMKYAELTKVYRMQLTNGTITAYDFIKQQNDEIQSLISQEVHIIQLLKAKYELLALRGQL
jgi:outer membrane protein TolC